MTPPAAGSVGLFKSPSERQPSCLPEHLWPPTVRPPKTLRHTWEGRHLLTDALERGRSRPTFPLHSVRRPLRNLAELLRQHVRMCRTLGNTRLGLVILGSTTTWSGAPSFSILTFSFSFPVAPLPPSPGFLPGVSAAKGRSTFLVLSFCRGTFGF